MHISLRERETEMADKHHEERDERLLFNMFLTDWLGSMEEKSVLYVPNNNFSRDARERERIMQLCLGAPCLKAALQISQTIKLQDQLFSFFFFFIVFFFNSSSSFSSSCSSLSSSPHNYPHPIYLYSLSKVFFFIIYFTFLLFSCFKIQLQVFSWIVFRLLFLLPIQVFHHFSFCNVHYFFSFDISHFINLVRTCCIAGASGSKVLVSQQLIFQNKVGSRVRRTLLLRMVRIYNAGGPCL